MLRSFVMALTFLSAAAAVGQAAVLCQKRSGALFARESCKKRETVVDPASLGLVGPKGDAGPAGEARAFACSQTSVGGLVAEPCAGLPSKNVTSIVANPVLVDVTCFVLDPSIDAKSAVILTTFHDPGFNDSVNVIQSAVGTDDQVGCPANSVAVLTGRYRQDTMTNGMVFEAVRLSVAIAVM
ncbi:MAG TPA: hypothetical protein VMS22_19025 [Candidatus Eisenbacteria bacterium]|nr:hypothetical protein [Candidatus Eisenbacteria bacterium]